jgi:radical SAM superfamily enzyme YgiQ (UPF0313 family)
MKVLIVNSPLFRYAPKHYDEDSLPPIGLGYIATSLQKNNVSVQLLDAIAHKVSLNNLKTRITKIKPEFIAINIFSTNYTIVKDLIEALNFDTHILVGGLSTRSLYKEIVLWKTNNQIDIVIGDGELITVDIINHNLSEKPLLETKNRRVFTINQGSKYFIDDISSVSLDREFFPNEPIKNNQGIEEVSIVSSRGCIYNCSFCSAARSLNANYRARERSAESIKLELTEIEKSYPTTKSIRILDDLFLKSKKSFARAIDIFESFNFQWRSMAHVKAFSDIDHNIVTSLRNCGCNELFIGIESGSPSILKSINKTHDTQLIIRNLTKIFQGGINVKGYFICGFPDETKDDLEMTYNLAVKLKDISIKYGSVFRTSVFQFRPYHGTVIYDALKEKNPRINLENITHNKRLSNLIGRRQFNFHSNNYSKVRLKTLHDYICKTNMI